MTQAVIDLLEKANAMQVETPNEVLDTGIKEVEALGEGAKGNAQEFKNLKAIVENIEAGGDGVPTPKEEKAGKVEKSKIKHLGTRQIGGKWYNKADDYKTGFGTADECSLHFNHK